MTIDSLDIRTIKRLTRKAQRDDEHAFESLAYALSASLYRVAASCLSSNEADIADALQDTLIAAWNSIHTLRQSRYFKTWLIRICINSCRQIQHTSFVWALVAPLMPPMRWGLFHCNKPLPIRSSYMRSTQTMRPTTPLRL